ncbi:PAS domain-containing sensor histidine kinase [Flavobacterium sp.]|uniref:sensor histidine kinase n=1 Tax=Flavobacterium sp. TaxID=239 RepID=UPI002638EE92|nr:PAS domain-containing sensor histidine kinase [Flavobacterium sp.]
MNEYLNDNQTIAEIRNHFAISASGIGVWDWNLITNEVYYSPESLKILEMEQMDSYISNPEEWDEKVHPDDRELYFGNIQLHFDNKIPYYETCHRVMCNGKYKWILDRGRVVERDIQGKPLRIVGTHTDVSIQKEREENLLETLSLVNNQKNTLLNFAHIVSHNLRTHSGNLSSILKLNEEKMFEKDEFIEYLKIVSKELTDSIDSLVELVTVQNDFEIEKKKLNVNIYIDKISNVLTDVIRKNKTEIINLVPDDFEVLFNSAYLESVLLNLTSNAIKYSDNSKLSYVKYSVEHSEGYRVLVIEDNGLGIDLEKYNDQIFGLYKTFHSNKDSKGVGLHITKNQIEAMGGKIEVQSKINEGTIFKIYFQ